MLCRWLARFTRSLSILFNPASSCLNFSWTLPRRLVLRRCHDVNNGTTHRSGTWQASAQRRTSRGAHLVRHLVWVCSLLISLFRLRSRRYVINHTASALRLGLLSTRAKSFMPAPGPKSSPPARPRAAAPAAGRRDVPGGSTGSACSAGGGGAARLRPRRPQNRPKRACGRGESPGPNWESQRGLDCRSERS